MHDYNIVEKGAPVTEAKKAIILLHGRGATAESILPLANEFADNSFYLAAPQATNNTWYPYSFMAPEKQNEPWLTSAVETVTRLINETKKHIPLENIYLMGFSQGACLTAEVAARTGDKFAGVASFTGGLIGASLNTDRYTGNLKNTSVFIGTSDVDPHIPVERAKESEQILSEMGGNVTLKIYENMPHTIIEDEIETVKKMMF